MRNVILPIALLLASVAPTFAQLGDVTITSAIRVDDNFGEVRGKVALNGLPGAFVTIKNGGNAISTLTDAEGTWSALFAIRSNNITASARKLDGQAAKADAAEARAEFKRVPPASPELFALTKGILEGKTAVTAANVARLAKLMDDAILHAGGWEYDERMMLLMLGCMGRIVETLDKMPVAQRQTVQESLGSLGAILYKGVVRGALDQKKAVKTGETMPEPPEDATGGNPDNPDSPEDDGGCGGGGSSGGGFDEGSGGGSSEI